MLLTSLKPYSKGCVDFAAGNLWIASLSLDSHLTTNILPYLEYFRLCYADAWILPAEPLGDRWTSEISITERYKAVYYV